MLSSNFSNLAYFSIFPIPFIVPRYEFYYTKRPEADLKYWIMKGVDPNKQYVKVDWTNDRRFTEVAPVLYWKVRLIGFVNKGPFSETKAFKCLPGGKEMTKK